MNKHYIGKITENIGEYEFSTTVRFTLLDGHSPWAHLDNLAKSWRLSDASYCDFLGGYDHGDGIAVNADDYKEVSTEAYLALEGIVADLNPKVEAQN